jgi:hypothetical protein
MNKIVASQYHSESEIFGAAKKLLREDALLMKSSQEECHKSRNYWPISFSYPRAHLEPIEKRNLFSRILPGEPYSFTNEALYLKTYSTSAYALTHRKAGWDCMRHLEILYSGSIPYIPDLGCLPKYTMTHYPKNFISWTNKLFLSEVIAPQSVYAILRKFNEKHLSTRSMASYLVSKFKGPLRRVIFYDESLPEIPDYLSIMTLIGLKELFGRNCLVTFPTPYLYEGYEGDSAKLYGGGFGYLKAIDTSKLNNNEKIGKELINYNPKPEELLVIGNISRNQSAIRHFRKLEKQSVYLHGEDASISSDGRISRLSRTSSALTFAREID